MEDIYTIRVKTKPDTRNLYPSERRYSASTVSGLAWVHIALAATSFLLACLALVNPQSEIKRIKLQDTVQTTVEQLNLTEISDNSTVTNSESSNNYILVLAPGLVTICALSAGVAAIMASSRWYVDRNISWLLIMSVISTVLSFTAFIMVTTWFATTSENDHISDFYTDAEPFKNVIVVKEADIIERNGSHYVIANNGSFNNENKSKTFTKKVLSINILIAAFLELLWSILSVKISYKGMKNNYKEDSIERPGNCISVITKVKGNAKKLPRNGKLIPPKPDLIAHYPNKNIKRIFLAQSDNGFYLKNQNDKNKNTDTSSEFYKERMLSYLNRCASLEGISNPDLGTPSVQSEAVLNPIPEVTSVEINLQETPEPPKTPKQPHSLTPVSWGDSPDHTVYNQNNINFDKIFAFGAKTNIADVTDTHTQTNAENSECVEVSENAQNN